MIEKKAFMLSGVDVILKGDEKYIKNAHKMLADALYEKYGFLLHGDNPQPDTKEVV